MSPERCKQLYRAFRAMPAEISTEMDAAEIALTTRQDWLRLHKGRTEAATEIWQAVRDRDPGLLRRAVKEAEAHPTASAVDVVATAEAFRNAANEARSRSQRTPDSLDAIVAPHESGIPDQLLEDLSNHLQTLLELLRSGSTLNGYVGGSLRLHLDELHSYLGDNTE